MTGAPGPNGAEAESFPWGAFVLGVALGVFVMDLYSAYQGRVRLVPVPVPVPVRPPGAEYHPGG